jgi:hypothetical protein
MARSKASASTLLGSSPFACMIRPIVSGISVRAVTLPFSLGSVKSCSIDVIGPPVNFGL